MAVARRKKPPGGDIEKKKKEGDPGSGRARRKHTRNAHNGGPKHNPDATKKKGSKIVGDRGIPKIGPL